MIINIEFINCFFIRNKIKNTTAKNIKINNPVLEKVNERAVTNNNKAKEVI